MVSESHTNSLYFMKKLNTMREEGEFCDLIFELNNSKICVHRLVMAVWSAPIKKCLQFQPASTQHIHLAYDKPEEFQKFITFLYTGVLPAKNVNISAVLLLAATFQISLLIDQCKEHLKKCTTPENVIGIFYLAIKFKLPDLEKHCVEFVCQHLEDVTQKQEFQDLMPKEMYFLLESEHMTNVELSLKLFLIKTWLAGDPSNRQQFLVVLLRLIDLTKVRLDFLMKILNTDNFFASNSSELYLLLHTLNSASINLGEFEDKFLLLQQQYGHLNSSVYNCSIVLGSDKSKHFQPLSFSLVSTSSKEDSGVNIDTAKIMGIKNEQILDYDSTNNYNCKSSEMQQSQVNIPQNISISKLNSFQDGSGNKFSQFDCFYDTDSRTIERSSKQQGMENTENGDFSTFSQQTGADQSTDRILLPLETLIGNVPSMNVKVNLRSKLLKSNKIKLDSQSTKSAARKLNSSKKITNISKVYNTRGRLRNVANNEIFKENKSTVQDTSRVLLKQSATGKRNPTDLNFRNKKKRLKSISTRSNKNSSGNKARSQQSNNIVRTRKSMLKLQEHKCCKCEYTAYNQVMLKKHQKQVHESHCLFSCSLCSFKSKWNKEFYDHLKESHFPGPPFQCDVAECEYSTDKVQELVSHRKQHNDRLFVCDICQTAFKCKNSMYQHIKIHSDEKKFECPECQRCFKLKNNLQQHLVTHSDLRPYLCDLCGFSTKFQSHLISHKKIHSGDVFRCSFSSCLYSTPKQSQMKSHMRSHLGIRSHVCSTCGKAFKEKSHLVRHERTHLSAKTHACNECSYSSNRSDKLKEHIQKHHNLEAKLAKAAAGPTKELVVSGNINTKKTTKLSNQCVSEIDLQPSIVEVVFVKRRVNLPTQSNTTVLKPILPNITSTAFNSRIVQAFPLISNQEAPLSDVFTQTADIRLSTGFDVSTKNEMELCAAKSLAQSFHLSDAPVVKETVFDHQVQKSVAGRADNASFVNPAITCKDEADDKMGTRELINQSSKEDPNLAIQSYSLKIDTSAQFLKPSTQFQQASFIYQQSHQTAESHPFITQPTISSITDQQYYHPQQHIEQLCGDQEIQQYTFT